MEQGFIDILKKVADKHGKEYFMETKKCKAIVSDYTGSDYRIERGLLLRAVEAGVSNAIFSADKADLDSCMKVQQRNLQEEQFMDSAIAGNVVNVLAHVLRDVALKEIRAAGTGGGSKFDEATSLYNDGQYDKAIPIFETLAKENHAGAQLYLGKAYLEGCGVTKDQAKAFEWYCKSADQGYADAQAELGMLYKQMVTLGYMTIEEVGAKAVEYTRKAADQGHAGGLVGLAQIYLTGYYGITKDEAKAVEYYRKAAGQGHNGAQFGLGRCYEEGKGITQDYAKAAEWYSKAAEQGIVSAQINLGNCYEEGKGVTQDYAKAAEWYSKAADKGSRFQKDEAQKKLDKLKNQNKIGNTASALSEKNTLDEAITHYKEKRYAEAVPLFQTLAGKGNAEAQYFLARCYFNGLGITQDLVKAVEWQLKSAEQGFAESQNSLGHMYKNGDGVPQNYNKAAEWYRKAADQGHGAGQFFLDQLKKEGKI